MGTPWCSAPASLQSCCFWRAWAMGDVQFVLGDTLLRVSGAGREDSGKAVVCPCVREGGTVQR